MGNAIRIACQQAKRNIFERVGRRLGVSPDDLETKEGMVYVRGNPDHNFEIARLFSGYHPEREQWGFYRSP